MLWVIAALIFLAGCLGGLVNSALSGELKLPYRDADARVYRPGWIGTVLVGGVAAAASWGVYGPLAQLSLIGPGPPSTLLPILKVAELFGAVVLGFGGGRWFSAEIDRVVLIKEKEALERATSHLTVAVRNARGEQP